MKFENTFMQQTNMILPAAFFISKNVKIVILKALSFL